MSDVQIAEHVGVSYQTVNNYRGAIYQKLTDTPRTVTRNGSTYLMDVANIGRRTPEPAPTMRRGENPAENCAVNPCCTR